MASGVTRKPSEWGLKRDQGGRPPAAAAQAASTVNQVQSSPPYEDSFWIFAVGASSGRNARILVHRGAEEHVCPTDFASATHLGQTKCSMLYDAQGHVIEAHGTRTVYMGFGPEGQSVGAEFSVTNVKSPMLSMGKVVKQGDKFETDCVQDVERESQPDVGNCEKFSLGGGRSLHDG